MKTKLKSDAGFSETLPVRHRQTHTYPVRFRTVTSSSLVVCADLRDVAFAFLHAAFRTPYRVVRMYLHEYILYYVCNPYTGCGWMDERLVLGVN